MKLGAERDGSSNQYIIWLKTNNGEWLNILAQHQES